MGDLQNQINRLFTNMEDNDSSGATAAWVPSVDIQEYNDRFELFIDLPGVDPTTVDVTLDSGVLTISGERASITSGVEEHIVHRRSERGYGSFHRRFSLPDTVDSENVKATGQNGVLEISIPKQAKAQPRRIQVAA
jgi:HSP20 family protein